MCLQFWTLVYLESCEGFQLCSILKNILLAFFILYHSLGFSSFKATSISHTLWKWGISYMIAEHILEIVAKFPSIVLNGRTVWIMQSQKKKCCPPKLSVSLFIECWLGYINIYYIASFLDRFIKTLKYEGFFKLYKNFSGTFKIVVLVNVDTTDHNIRK